MIQLLASSGDAGVDRAVEDVIATIASSFAEYELGYYLHGSAASRSMTSDSDIDLLASGDATLSSSRREEVNALVNRRGGELDERLDLKVFSWREFATDPWVGLDAVIHLHGKDWRATIGQPSVDQRARESVLMVCLSSAALRDRTTVPAPPLPIPESSMDRPLHKYVGWLISALLAARHGHVPPGRERALASLEISEPERAARLRGLHDAAREIHADANERATLADRLNELEVEVIELLVGQARRRIGPLGPASWAVVQEYTSPAWRMPARG